MADDNGPLITDEEHDAHRQVMPGITPAAVIEAMEDPTMFEEMARADLYVQMAYWREQARHPDMSNSARMEYTKFLARMGKVDAPIKDGTSFDSLPQISIVLPNSGGQVNIGAVAVKPQEKDVTPSDQDVVSSKPAKAVLP